MPRYQAIRGLSWTNPSTSETLFAAAGSFLDARWPEHVIGNGLVTGEVVAVEDAAEKQTCRACNFEVWKAV